MNRLSMKDPVLSNLLAREENRQAHSLEMIASESMQPRETLLLGGSAFNNKTAVGTVGRQRLLGAENAEALEKLAADRACALFGAEHANMTAYSGTMANLCAYAAVMKPGDRALALEPACGAHQSHGGKGNATAAIYSFDFFGLHPETLDIHYEEAAEKAARLQPKLIVVGSAAYPRRIDFARLAGIAHDNGAYLMVDAAHFTGLIAAGLSPNPVPHADIVTASTTKTLCGPHSGFIMCKRELADAVERSVYPGHVASVHLQTIAAMAYALHNAATPGFRQLMQRVVDNASALSGALLQLGFDVFTGGTDCHMLLASPRSYGTDGVRLAANLEEIGLTVNSKSFPFDPSPVAMGIRIGTTVLSQRGMGAGEMQIIAGIMADCAAGTVPANKLRQRVSELCECFPIPKEYLPR